jgi:hypothetical protein
MEHVLFCSEQAQREQKKSKGKKFLAEQAVANKARNIWNEEVQWLKGYKLDVEDAQMKVIQLGNSQTCTS